MTSVTPGQQHLVDEAVELGRVVEVPPARLDDVGHRHARQPVGGIGRVEARAQPGIGGHVGLQGLAEHGDDERRGLLELREHPARLGGQEALEHRVPGQGRPGRADRAHQAVVEVRRPVGGRLDGREVAADLPGDRLVDELLAPTGEPAVHRRPADAGLARHLLDGEVGQAGAPGDGHDAGEDPVAGGDLVAHDPACRARRRRSSG